MAFPRHASQSILPVLWALLLLLPSATAQAGLTIAFDYTYDSSGFFSDPARRDTLERAAALWNRFIDDLDAIAPSGSNHWTYQIPRPDNPNYTDVTDDIIAANTIKVYVGGRSMASTTLALGGGAILWTSPGSSQWQDTVHYRGESGASLKPATDYAPFAGSIAFNSSQNWYFGIDTAGLQPAQVDFLTVATHELGHVLGVGPADSWQTKISAGQFTGAHSMAVGSNTNPQLNLDAPGGHWAVGTKGLVGATTQTALLNPNVTLGQRMWPTTLDRAAMLDIGWQEAMPGDVDRDRDVDVADIQAILSANRFGLGPTAASWLEGDFDGDLQVAASDIQLVLRANLFGKGPYDVGASSNASSDAWQSMAIIDTGSWNDDTYTALQTSAFPLSFDQFGDSSQAIAALATTSPATRIVPEPGTLVMSLCAAILAAWALLRRRS